MTKVKFLTKDEIYTNIYECKNCEYNLIIEDANFCANCGDLIYPYEEEIKEK